MSEHTPGPYEVEEYLNASHSNHQRLWSYGVKAGKTRLAVCCDVPASRENAHLFAAAPETAAERDRLKEVNSELLAALKAVMGEWKDGYGLNCVEQVRAAIAKAEGKS